jgi:hypothetical protein
MWRNHPSCVRSWSALITFKSSKSSKEVHPGSIGALYYAFLVAIANVTALHIELFSFSLHHGWFFRPLSPIVISVTTVRHHDVALPSISATVFTTPRPHELTLLSSVPSTPDTRVVKWPLQPRSGYKREPLPRTADAKAPFSSVLSIITVLVLLLASLATLPLAHLSHLFRPSRASCSLCSSPTSRRSLK